MATPIPVNKVCFTADEIIRATGARTAFDGDVCGVCLDSRLVEPGNLFIALRGEVHDAQQFVPQARQRGASAVLVDREPADADPRTLVVDDAVSALGALAAVHRRRLDRVEVVGVTGSVGKTTTKELIAAALRATGRETLATRGNLNNRIGVPMTLFLLDESHDAAVIEMGMSEPGEIAALAAMAAPRIGVVTSVAEVHTAGVDGIEGVAREKGELLAALPEDGAAIWNADDAAIRVHGEASRALRKIPYGRSEAAVLRVTVAAVNEDGTYCRFALGERQLAAELRLLGSHAALNAGAALAVVAALDEVRLEEAATALGEVEPMPQRMVPIWLGSGTLLIDDSYNASPRSTVAALVTCAAIAALKARGLIAVLGDMLELGAREQALHEEVGREAVRLGAKALVVCGERMSYAGREALSATMAAPSGSRTKIVILRHVEDAAACVRELIEPRDVVLVKGSRGMRMERVVEALVGDR